MPSYIHFPVMVVCFILLLAMWRFWACINRMGFTKEVGRRAPSLVQGDLLAACFAIMPFLIAVVDWFGITLPRLDAPAPPLLAAFMSVGFLGASVFVLRESGERFAGHWAGTRESALRTVAALRIIEAAELAHALKYVQAREEQAIQSQGRVIDADVQEIQK